VENHVIENLLERNKDQDDTALESGDPRLLNNPLFKTIYNDLLQDKLVIPTLPKIALGVRSAIEQDLPVRKIELLIQADPALASLLVKTANSALYRSRQTVTTIEQAIIRMGLRVVKNLVTSYSLKNLFTTDNQHLKQRMKQLWVHNAEVAAVCFVLARHLKRFDPEHALLLGLLHNVGVLPVLSYARQFPDIVADEAKLDATIDDLKAEVGSIILSKWQFAEEFVTVAREAEQWLRDESGKTDYCDLVLVAKLHTYIGRGHTHKHLPQLYEIPAFKKMGLAEDNPGSGLSILADANDQSTEVRQLLSI
jgi:HD-like signal output (HDOD) protein